MADRHASRARPRLRPDVYVARHLQAMFFTLGRLTRTPLSTLMTVVVIGVALALPTGLQVLVNNTRALSGAWEGTARITVFLQQAVDTDQAREIAGQIRGRPDVTDVKLITADAALSEFKAHSGFGGALNALDDNPLPAVLVVQPLNTSAAAAGALADELRRLPQTDVVQLDTQWLKRLNAILDIIHRAAVIVAVLFALAVIVIVGNTIRLDIQNHRQEIEVEKLVGATDAFIRRPFLYSGFWYGVAGGIFALILVVIALALLSDPVSQLAGLYGSNFVLQGLSGDGALTVLLAGSLLGWLGSWSAVTRHLGEIEPS